MEANRLGLNGNVETSDVSFIGPLMVGDNIKFFLSSATELAELKHELEDIREVLKKDGKELAKGYQQRAFDFQEDLTSSPIAPYLVATKLIEKLKQDQPREEQEYYYSEDFIQRLSCESYLTRFIFYVALRAVFRYQGGYTRHVMDFQRAFLKSLDEIISQIDQLAKSRIGFEGSQLYETPQGYLVFQGMYSLEVVSSFFVMRVEEFSGAVRTSVATRDARALDKNSLDVIICDPPYGFNTTEDQGELATLYSEFIDAAVRALRTQGHLIICLPAESYTGRDLPYCTRSDMITNQVLIKANLAGRAAYIPANSLPSRGFSPPYYWEADKALRRSILHFRLI